MKKKIYLDIIFNIIIILSVCIGMVLHIILTIDDTADGGGFATFRYFTNLSNIFCALIALWVVIKEISMLKHSLKELPYYLIILRQMATCAVAVTFFTVAFIFVPLLGKKWFSMYTGQRIMTHLTTPLLSIISSILFTEHKSLNWKENFFSIIPEFVYGIVYEIEVPILNNWDDFYGFTLGGRWYAPFIVIPAMSLMAYLFSLLFSFLHKKCIKNNLE